MFFDKKSNDYKSVFVKIVAVFMSAIIFCLLTGAVMDVQAKRVRLVMVDEFADTEKTRELTTRQNLVGEFFEENQIDVGEFDRVNMLFEDELYDDVEIIVRKGRKFTLYIDVNIEIITTTKKTIREAFEEAGVSISQADIVVPGPDSEVAEDMEVTVSRIACNEVTEETAIPFTVKKVSDKSLEKGKTKVKVKGQKGIRKIVYSVTTRDGVEVRREVISDTVTREPKEQVVAVGTKAKTNAKKSVVTNAGATLNYSKKMTVTATAYTAAPGKKTASGRVAQYGVIAVDPKVIPYGTKLYVESTDDGKSWQYGYCVAGDTGGAIKGNKIDLYFNSRNECLQFGRRSAIVYVLE